MNRNTELHFGSVPKISVKRSTFDRSSSVKTTFNTGSLIPVKVYEVLPGDTVKMDLGQLVRMATPIYPVMDNLFEDVYAFFVPNRLLWKNHAAFWGENNDPWIQQTEYEIPQIKSPSGGWTEGTIADYMGIPTKVSNLSVNALPFRGYVKIWNDWFRDENLKACAHMYDDETTRNGSNSGDYVTNAELGAQPIKVAKMHDYFTSCLPSAQKGQPVSIPLGTIAPISGTPSGLTATTTLSGGGVTQGTLSSKRIAIETDTNDINSAAGRTPLRFIDSNYSSGTSYYNMNLSQNSYVYTAQRGASVTPPSGTNPNLIPSNLKFDQNQLTLPNLTYTRPTASTTIGGTLSGLSADLSQATAATINQLRMAFAIQKYYETAARYGTRYIEYLRGIFGVTSSDARMQRAEYLGGTRVPINMDQIIQTSATDTTSPQGNTAGFSCTIDKTHLFTKSFEEHGYLYVLICVRPEHTYQQGLNKMWSRKKWTDFYNPIFANLSEQPVYEREIYAQGTAQDEEAFGYQEAWAEYRYEPNQLSGYMRSNATGSLDVWHYADNYNTRPLLSGAWIDETVENVDRTIAVTSQLTHQFIADYYFKTKWTRPMPVYSIPKLVG